MSYTLFFYDSVQITYVVICTKAPNRIESRPLSFEDTNPPYTSFQHYVQNFNLQTQP